MLLDGKKTSLQIKEELKEEVLWLKEEFKAIPKLVIIQVGHVAASDIYIRNKLKAASFVGIDAELINFTEDITNSQLLDKIKELNTDDSVSGIIVQLPLPAHLDEELIINEIDNTKDVDGFGLLNKGKLFCGLDGLKPATPYGIIKLLELYNIDLTSKNAVVIGRSNIVGKPMAMLLLNKNATVTICHSRTKNLKDICKRADLVVVAIGKAKYINHEYIKDDAIVIDVGMNRDENNKLCGDVDFEDVKDIVSYITPVPGGVGPLTIAMLLYNTVTAFKNRRGIKC